MNRRDFVQRLPVVTSGLLVGTSALSLAACGGVRYVVPRSRPGGLVISAAELAATGEAFVQAPDMERPVYVRREISGDVVAVHARCTHRGCQPEPIGDRLVCPCHGSEFSFEGTVLRGPAELSLTRYGVSEEGDDLIVWVDGRGGP